MQKLLIPAMFGLFLVALAACGKDTTTTIDSAKPDTFTKARSGALVELNFREKHSIGEYAAMLHRSPKTLSNVFRTLGQPSPLDIIHDRIALEARRMLRFSDKQVKEISHELGFGDAAHFAHFFKKQTGSFPMSVRNDHPFSQSRSSASSLDSSRP